jgi:hypothetical protein
MFNLGPMDIECDAPPYSVVKACKGLGFQLPLDVRWCRMSYVLRDQGEVGGAVGFHPLRWLFGSGQPPRTSCSCGQPLPLIERYAFTVASKKEAHYLLGQCSRCRTIYWEEASVPSGSEASPAIGETDAC